MTIFLKALKKLVKDDLTKLIEHLKGQIGSYGHNPGLSYDQHERIMVLDNELICFQGTGNDAEDMKRVIETIDTAIKNIQTIRISYGQQGNIGNTYSTLNNLRSHARSFIDKVSQFKTVDPKVDLLDIPYSNTPEHIIYYHACCYFGDELFNPNPNKDVEVRALKEKSLINRLNLLGRLIVSDSGLDEQRREAIQFLTDLRADNLSATKKDESSLPIPLPSVKVFGIFSVSAPLELFAPGLGNLANEFNMASRKINALTPEHFATPDESGQYRLPNSTTMCLKALKKVVKDNLCHLLSNLKGQIDACCGYDIDLSRDQYDAIVALETRISCFHGKETDRESIGEIKELIDNTLKNIQAIREAHDKVRDNGNTVSCLNNLRNHITTFFDKISDFNKLCDEKFTLLDRLFAMTPENLLYYRACCYFAEESFISVSSSEQGVKKNIEEELARRLQFLSEIIKPEHSLEERQARSSVALNDLAGTLNKHAVPTFFGMFAMSSNSSDLFNASLGGFAREFNAATRQIKALNAEEFNPDHSPASSSLPSGSALVC